MQMMEDYVTKLIDFQKENKPAADTFLKELYGPKNVDKLYLPDF